jgi:hypothetical protein
MTGANEQQRQTLRHVRAEGRATAGPSLQESCSYVVSGFSLGFGRTVASYVVSGFSLTVASYVVSGFSRTVVFVSPASATRQGATVRLEPDTTYEAETSNVLSGHVRWWLDLMCYRPLRNFP